MAFISLLIWVGLVEQMGDYDFFDQLKRSLRQANNFIHQQIILTQLHSSNTIHVCI